MSTSNAVGIIYYGAGNIFSLTAALDRLGIKYGLIKTVDELASFDRYIIPGVGHAGVAMQKLIDTGLVANIKALKKPVLGICVGMQLLTAFSEEGHADMLDIIPINTLRFKPEWHIKVPHMGWNNVSFQNGHPLFKGIVNDSQFYFVHSYFIEYNPTFTIASTNYGLDFASAINRDNFYGVQFHPEKSGVAGEQLLINFTKISS